MANPEMSGDQVNKTAQANNQAETKSPVKAKLQKVMLNNDQIRLTQRIFADNFWQFRFGYLRAFIFMGIAAAATGLSAYIIKDIVNTVFATKDMTMTLYLGVFTFVIFSVKGLATYAHTVTLARIGNKLVAGVQKRVFSHLISLPMAYFDRVTLGEVFIRASRGVEATNNIITSVIMSVGRDIMTLMALVAVMIIQEPLISMTALLIGPFCVVLINQAARKIKRNAHAQLAPIAEQTSIMKETITGIQMIKTFTLEAEMMRRIKGVVEEIRWRSDKMASLSARTSPIMETIGGTVIAAAIIYAGWRSVGDPEYIGRMVSFMMAFLLAYEPAKRLAKLRVNLEPHFVNVNHMYELLDNEQPERKGAKGKADIQSAVIRFDNVYFGYKSGIPTLDGVSLTARENEKIALVGPSGSGKSTIFKLLLQLYDQDGGDIYIGEANSHDLTLQQLRESIAYVGQEAHLLTGTVHENIRFGKLDATDDEIVAAAQAASAHDFICGFSDGYDTFVGENGAQLSGGQRQRIAIARAFLKNASIILLDEATSALDTESEREIQTAIDELLKGRTTVSIAHRLSTIKNSDCIYVMKDGKVVESGDHDELLSKDGTYAYLYKLQFGGQESADD